MVNPRGRPKKKPAEKLSRRFMVQVRPWMGALLHRVAQERDIPQQQLIREILTAWARGIQASSPESK